MFEDKEMYVSLFRVFVLESGVKIKRCEIYSFLIVYFLVIVVSVEIVFSL